MQKLTLRGYVWIFCVYLSSTVQWLAGPGAAHHEPNVHLPIFLTFFPIVLANVFLTCLFFMLIREVDNRMEKGVCILSAIAFALDAAANLHQFGYMPINIWPSLSGLLLLFATVLLGYRTDQILKKNNSEIETDQCPAAL